MPQSLTHTECINMAFSRGKPFDSQEGLLQELQQRARILVPYLVRGFLAVDRVLAALDKLVCDLHKELCHSCCGVEVPFFFGAVHR